MRGAWWVAVVMVAAAACAPSASAEDTEAEIAFYNLTVGETLGAWTNRAGQVWVVYGASYCPSCRRLDRTLQAFLAEHPAVTAVYVDIDRHRQLAQERSVQIIPAMEIFVNGQAVSRIDEGLVTEGYLTAVYETVTEVLGTTRASLADAPATP